MSNVIIVGDLHIGHFLSIGKTGAGSTLNSRIVDQLNLLDWILDYAIDKTIQNIIITGDVFEDPKPSSLLITLFIKWLKKCQVHNVSVHIIAGNHDMLCYGSQIFSPLDIISEVELENVSIYKQIETIVIGVTAFTLMPYRDRKSLNCKGNAESVSLLRESLIYELESIPKTYHKVAIGHFALEGSIYIGNEVDDISGALFCPFDMFNGYDYVWMGHVHTPQIIRKSPSYIAHIGSLDISNFDEADQKKHIVIFDCHNSQFDIEYLPTRPLKKFSISVPKGTEDSTAYIIDKLKDDKLTNSIVRVEVTLDDITLKSINKAEINKILTSKGAYNVAGISETKKVALIKKSESKDDVSIKMDVESAINAYVMKHVDDNNKKDFIDMALDIYNEIRSDLSK